MPGSLVPAVKLLSLFHVAPKSVLFHNPSCREPKKRMLGELGSTWRRSPEFRPVPLPLARMIGVLPESSSVPCHVRPWSVERNMYAGPPYVPATMYTRLALVGSRAIDSTPPFCVAQSL